MHAWEIYTFFRNMDALKSESDISTPELMRLINMAYNSIVRIAWDEARPSFIVDKTITGQNSASTIYVPTNADKIINVFRSNAGTPKTFYKSTLVETELRHLIDVSPNLIAAEQTPLHYVQGNAINISPVLPTSPSSADIRIQYLRKFAPVLWGLTTTPASAGDIKFGLALDYLAPKITDIYSGYTFLFYQRDPTYTYWDELIELQANTYTASTRKVIFSDTDWFDWFDVSTEYLYSIYPIIDSKYHDLIIRQTKINLIDLGKIPGDIGNEIKVLAADLLMAGIDVSAKGRLTYGK